MEADAWSRFAAASKRHQTAIQSRYDLYLGFEEVDGGEDDPRADFPCPFCSDDFDIVGLCCHIDDEHPVESKNGICPVCMCRVGMDMVGHITTQHASFFKMQRRRRFRRGSSGSHSTLSLLRKELREGNLQSLIGGSSYAVHPSTASPDPFLSSLIYTLPLADSSRDAQPESLDEGSLVNKCADVKVSERYFNSQNKAIWEGHGVWEVLSPACLTRTRKNELGGVNLCRGFCCRLYLKKLDDGIRFSHQVISPCDLLGKLEEG